MANVELPYGHGTLSTTIPDANSPRVLLPRQFAAPPHEAPLLREALDHPVGTARLQELVRPAQRVAIITSDLTRPCPSDRLVPPVLDELTAAGVSDDQVTVVVALGLHRPMTGQEIAAAVGPDVCRRVRVVNHDPDKVVYLGTTSFGTPVELFQPLVEADVRVCLGNLELHYFAGYSGGAKAVLPGCASRATIRANHSLMVRPGANAGGRGKLGLAGNPVRADLEEGAAMLGIDFLLNVVVEAAESSAGEHSLRIVGAVAGEVTAAHRRGCELVAARGIVDAGSAADVVVVSAGGYPKDVNLYQAQKALDNAAQAVREGGTIVLVAECPEGLGNATFQSWLDGAPSPASVLDRICQGFVLGGHKAAAVASVLTRARVYLVSALPADLVRRCGLVPFDDLDAALVAALDDAGPGADLLVLPQGGSILPLVGRQ